MTTKNCPSPHIQVSQNTTYTFDLITFYKSYCHKKLIIVNTTAEEHQKLRNQADHPLLENIKQSEFSGLNIEAEIIPLTGDFAFQGNFNAPIEEKSTDQRESIQTGSNRI